jgi:hypothetical protein
MTRTPFAAGAPGRPPTGLSLLAATLFVPRPRSHLAPHPRLARDGSRQAWLDGPPPTPETVLTDDVVATDVPSVPVLDDHHSRAAVGRAVGPGRSHPSAPDRRPR